MYRRSSARNRESSARASAVSRRNSDPGIGITAEALPRIFERFIHDTHAITFNQAGLGIGLTVVRELIVAQGGSVTAQSGGRDLGSQFVVKLPLAPYR
ncbi:ATP-binding protein [Caballeronia jiangsuensis]|uniref:ATP-binding protein n=1 Tax=Caballeronia TaxID=1827195 RepID=UPI0038B6EDE5